MLTSTAQGIQEIHQRRPHWNREGCHFRIHVAGWYPQTNYVADERRNCGSVLFDRPYKDAPVSPLFFEGGARPGL